jgi:hypothetical protein
LETPFVSEITALFADPARRDNKNQRTKNIKEFSPSIDEIFDFCVDKYKTIIKLGPTFQSNLNNTVSIWIGYQGECKERLVLKNTTYREEDAVILFDNMDFEEFNSVKNNLHLVPIDLSPALPDKILVIPHPTLIASNLLNAKNAVFISDFPYEDISIIEQFLILKTIPFDLKKIEALINELNWSSHLEIKKKNFELTPDEVRKKIKFKYRSYNNNDGVIFLTKIGSKKIAIFCKRIKYEK